MSPHLGRRLERAELVRHCDGDATRNAAGNLSIGSAKNNAADKLTHNTYGKVLRNADAREIRLLARRSNVAALAARYGVSASHVRAIRAGRSWAGLAV